MGDTGTGGRTARYDVPSTAVPSRHLSARELYKAVLWLHGEAPPFVPAWGKTLVILMHPNENPVLTSQKVRARQGLAQLEDSLNYYDASDAMVPTLRYRTLKEAADRFAAQARTAQQIANHNGPGLGGIGIGMTVLDPATNATFKLLADAPQPDPKIKRWSWEVAVAPGGHRVYLTNSDDRSVSVVEVQG